MPKPSILVCTPMYGGQCYGTYIETLFGFFSACSQRQIEARYAFVYNESLVQRARNTLANVFLAQKQFTHLFFIDSDIRAEPAECMALIDADEMVVGGSYPKKAISWQGVRAAVQAGVPNEHLEHCTGDHVVHLPPGTHEIDVRKPYPTPYIGTGFMLIKREAFEAFMQKFPNSWVTSHDPNIKTPYWVFFDCAIENDESNKPIYLSEDYWFCYRMRDCGIVPKFLPWVAPAHTGTYTFRGCKFCSIGKYVHDILPKGSSLMLQTEAPK